MTMEQQPRSPVYLSYIYNHPEPMMHPSTISKPYHPSTHLSNAELDLQSTRGIYEHFHAPCNEHNRFLSSVREEDKYAYRDLPRMAPPPFDKSGRSSIRPQSAPRPRTSGMGASPARKAQQQIDISGATLLDNMVTLTGAPCYTVSATIHADVSEGKPLVYPEALEDGEEWKVARVQTYSVPPAKVGYGEGGVRPFHQDYRHYKYYGFAGRGAKTSWAHNPKYSQIYSEIMSSPADSTSPASVTDLPDPEPLQATIGGPRRPLTKAEAKLVLAFSQHTYAAEGSPSQAPTSAERRSQRSQRDLSRPRTAPSQREIPPAEVIDPYIETVNILTRQPLSPDQRASRQPEKARVATYRQPAPGAFTLTENASPNHGSQSPFHQRYAHYKYNGFGGKGATSSWARNPKYALLYEH